MATALLCTDGSPRSIEALRQGLALLAPLDRVVVVTVAAAADPALVTGTGFAGGVMTFDEKQDLMSQRLDDAQRVVDDTVRELELVGAETMVETGDAGREICRLVDALAAGVVVIGTHGRGGIKRAVIGSTSDYVVRHAACPVLVQGTVG